MDFKKKPQDPPFRFLKTKNVFELLTSISIDSTRDPSLREESTLSNGCYR
jgi:hypothetical protein